MYNDAVAIFGLCTGVSRKKLADKHKKKNKVDLQRGRDEDHLDLERL